MRRRTVIEGIAALAAVWPFAARAQQSNTVRRVGVLMNFRADEPEGQARVRAFTQGLQKLGWSEGSNLQIDTRWRETIPVSIGDTRRSWSSPHRTSSLPPPARML